MALRIETFSNSDLRRGWRPGNNAGGHALFKALGHPLAARRGAALVADCAAAGPLAIYDPRDTVEAFDALFALSQKCEIAELFVQRVEDRGRELLGHQAKLVSELKKSSAKSLLVLAFDSARLLAQLRHLLPEGMQVFSLDGMRLDQDMLTNTDDYVDPLNFATNFSLLRDVAPDGETAGLHTRITTANYWSMHGARDPELWLCLFDMDGSVLAEWRQALPAAGALVTIDSQQVRERFGLDDFCGSLFIHALRVAGHDIVKYALDIYGDEGRALSCSHDANAWPADYFAGMPAPASNERLILHIQNSHPIPIPSGSVGLGIMGGQQVSLLERDIAPFATYSLDVADLLPDAKWPDQIEIHAGRYFVRPRYEVVRKDGRRRIAHANVERTDLEPNPDLAALSEVMGKGYIMPLPVLPAGEFSTTILPTPMATGQRELPVRADLYDMSGECVARHFMGRLQRRDSVPLALDEWLAEAGTSLPSGAGHVELVYDFRDGGEGDGWLHALGQYTQRASGHMAETIFGAHIYNTPIIYKDEPQSYTGSPPGLTTRLFLRLGQNFGSGIDGLCHLIYPASMPWHPVSDTRLILHDGNGEVVGEQHLQIACGGSRFWRFSDMFSQADRTAAGADAYIIVRDTTCRLFGFHGLQQGEQGFCLDHMFGF